MSLKDLLGGQGRQPGRDDVGARAAGAAGLHHLHRRLPGLPGRRLAGGPRRARSPQHVRRPRGGHGQAHRRPGRPAAGERALGRQVLDAGDDGHRPQPRAQRRVGRGPGQADRRALRLRLLPPVHRHVRPDRARPRRRAVRPPARDGQGVGRRRAPTPTITADTLRRLCLRYKDVVARPHRPGLPPGPRPPAAGGHRGRVQLVEGAAGRRLPEPGAHPPRPRHRRERAGHGLRQPGRELGHRRRASPATRPPARRAPTATSW